jgi:hypothetical protein
LALVGAAHVVSGRGTTAGMMKAAGKGAFAATCGRAWRMFGGRMGTPREAEAEPGAGEEDEEEEEEETSPTDEGRGPPD